MALRGHRAHLYVCPLVQDMGLIILFCSVLPLVIVSIGCLIQRKCASRSNEDKEDAMAEHGDEDAAKKDVAAYGVGSPRSSDGDSSNEQSFGRRSALAPETAAGLGESHQLPPAVYKDFCIDIVVDEGGVESKTDSSASDSNAADATGPPSLTRMDTNTNIMLASDTARGKMHASAAAVADETPSTMAAVADVLPGMAHVTSFTSIKLEEGDEEEDSTTEEASSFVALETLRGSFAAVTCVAASLRRSGTKASNRKLSVDDSCDQDYREDRKEMTHQVAVPQRVRPSANAKGPSSAIEASVTDRMTRRKSRCNSRSLFITARTKALGRSHADKQQATAVSATNRTTLADILRSTSSARLETERHAGAPPTVFETTVASQGLGWNDPHQQYWQKPRPGHVGGGRFVRRNHRGERMSTNVASTHLRHPPPSDQWWFEGAIERSGVSKIIGEMRRSIKRNAARL